MSIISDRVQLIAKLSKLPLREEEILRFGTQLDPIMDYLENLKQVNTENVLPTRQVTGLANVVRADSVSSAHRENDLLHCSPLPKEDGHILVPSVFA